jgi:hypothetical protein
VGRDGSRCTAPWTVAIGPIEIVSDLLGHDSGAEVAHRSDRTSTSSSLSTFRPVGSFQRSLRVELVGPRSPGQLTWSVDFLWSSGAVDEVVDDGGAVGDEVFEVASGGDA